MTRYWLGLVAFSLVCVSFVWAQTPSEFKGHDGIIHSVAFSSDGTMLATASFDNTVKVWNYSTGKESQILKGHTSPVTAVAFSNDGAIVATGSDDKTIRFWNPKDGKSSKELKGHTGGVSSLAFSPDGQTLASGSSDKSVRLWNVKEGKELKNLGAHTESVYSVAFSKDGGELASCGNDGIIKIWDIKGQKEIKALKVDLPKPVVKIEPKKEEPKTKEIKGKKENKKKMAKKEEPKELRDAFTVVAFTPDGKQILSVGHDKYLRYWSLADGKETKKLGPTPDYIFGLSISKDGKYVATAGYGGSLRVYELASGDRVFPSKEADAKKDAAQLKAADQARRGWITYCAAFAPDGKSVVTGVHEIRAQKYTVKVTSVLK